MKPLILLAILVFTAGANGLVTKVELPSGTYGLTPEFIRRGDFSIYLKNSYPLGQLKPATASQVSASTPADLGIILGADIQDNKKNMSAVNELLQSAHRGLDSENVVLPGQMETNEPPESKPGFELDSCLDLALGLLKQKLQLSFVVAGDGITTEDEIAAHRSVEVIQNRLLPFRAAGGMVCGKGNAYLENAKIADDVTQIKLLSALKVRKGKERKTLLMATAIAYGPLENEKIRETWITIWSRLTILAVFKSDLLVTPKDIVAELSSAQSSQSTNIAQGRLNITATVKLDISRIQNDLAEGETILESVYAQK